MFSFSPMGLLTMLVIITFFIKLIFRVEIKGQYLGGKANGQEKTLIIANHSSFLDAILLLLFLPEKPIFVIHKESARSKFYRFFMRYADYISVDTSHPMPMRKVIRKINQGRPVVIFPEGRVTVTGTLMKLYSGASFAALKTGATIIPVQISGTKYSYFSRLDKLFTQHFFPKIGLTIFPPTSLKAGEIADHDTQIRVGREDMHNIMMEMVIEARERMTLFEMLLDSRDKYGKNKLAYRDNITDDLTYGSLVTKSVSLAVLLQRKVTLSKRVGILLPNANAGALAFYAMQYCGRSPVMLNFTAGIRAITAGLMAAEVKTVLTSRRFIEKGDLQPLIDAMTGYDVVYLEDLRKSITTSDKLAIVLKRLIPRRTMVKKAPEDEAMVLFTSGSEGIPKGVVHSHDSLMTQLEQIKAIYDFNPNDRFMLCLPTFHVFGLMAGYALPISAGSSGVLYPSPLHYKVIPELIYENSCTVLFGTSTFLSGYARCAESYDMHSLRYVIAGAERMSPEVAKVYSEKFGVRVMEGYGATETAPVMAAETIMAHRRGTVGRMAPGVRAELVPVKGIDEGGRVIVSGDNIMLGYLRADNPGVIEKSPVGDDGKRIYDTGDIATIDEQGFVQLRGRVKRFAKIAGEMVSLDTVEKLATHASPDAQHASIIVTDRKGETILLCTTDKELTRKHLQQASKEMEIPKLAVPKTIEVVKEIPVFTSGKTNYPALSEYIAEKETEVSPSLISQIRAQKESLKENIKEKTKNRQEKKENQKEVQKEVQKDNLKEETQATHTEEAKENELS